MNPFQTPRWPVLALTLLAACGAEVSCSAPWRPPEFVVPPDTRPRTFVVSGDVFDSRADQKVSRHMDPELLSTRRVALDLPRGALVASSAGYSLHAATHIDAEARDALERLLRYMARPPLAMGRLMLREDGKVIWNLRRPWSDGTRSFVFEPLTLIGRLAALVPHSREHQLTYHGLCAGNAADPSPRRRRCATTSCRALRPYDCAAAAPRARHRTNPPRARGSDGPT